jgi:dTMP kinase
MNNRGTFFCFEGIEGAGKSTLINSVNNELQKEGFATLLTREPGGTMLGKEIREILLNSSQHTSIHPLAELLLFFSDRAQHLSEVIIPALNHNKTILCDRFIYSTIAYQCYGRGLDRAPVETLINLTLGSIRPHGVILLDIPVETGLQRASKRSTPDRFEKENISFHTKIREGFLEQAKANPELFLVLDAEKDPEILRNDAIRFIESRIRQNR